MARCRRHDGNGGATGRILMTFRYLGLAAALASALGLATPVHAATELQWWHAMTGGNNDVINKLSEEFNASQTAYKVVPSYKGNYTDTMNAGIAAFRAGNAPHIVQVFEVGTATMMSITGAIKPVYQLMKDAGEPFDSKAYLPSISNFFSTSGSDMLSLPFNTASMVMWINKDELKKAGVAQIPKTWPEVFEAARKLKAAGHTTCGFTNAWATWAHIEQFSAWHNLPVATGANGLNGFDTELKFNSPLHVKHLQNLIDLQKDRTYDYSGRANGAEGRFASGECAILLTSSGYYATLKSAAKFDFTSAPMPYYPDVQGAPQNSIVGGASLWAMGGKKPEEFKGVARFFAFLSDTDRQARLHQQSGYLPITKAAYAKSVRDGFYERNPVLQTPLKELTNKEPTGNSSGLRFGNMVQVRDIWAEEMEAALAGRKTAQAALDAAVARGNAMLRQFQRAVGVPVVAQKTPNEPSVFSTRPVTPPVVAQAPAQNHPAPTAVPLDQGRRIALVIGNSAYRNVSPLSSPPRDASMIAAALQQVGFQSVTLLTDLDKEKFVNALQAFAQAANNADWALVYFAGHGMEVGGVNYLIPIDARLAIDKDMEFQGVQLSAVLNATERARMLSLVILDSCRDNPFANQMKRTVASRSVSRGLARVEPDPGTMVVFAAKHGETALDDIGGNSPFAAALAKNIQTPGLEVRLLFDTVRDDVMELTGRQQQPFSYGSISGRKQFYFQAPR
jgi:sn-glycerol 3-phosphate transport system substrate-binding protein